MKPELPDSLGDQLFLYRTVEPFFGDLPDPDELERELPSDLVWLRQYCKARRAQSREERERCLHAALAQAVDKRDRLLIHASIAGLEPSMDMDPINLRRILEPYTAILSLKSSSRDPRTRFVVHTLLQTILGMGKYSKEEVPEDQIRTTLQPFIECATRQVEYLELDAGGICTSLVNTFARYRLCTYATKDLLRSLLMLVDSHESHIEAYLELALRREQDFWDRMEKSGSGLADEKKVPPAEEYRQSLEYIRRSLEEMGDEA